MTRVVVTLIAKGSCYSPRPYALLLLMRCYSGLWSNVAVTLVLRRIPLLLSRISRCYSIFYTGCVVTLLRGKMPLLLLMRDKYSCYSDPAQVVVTLRPGSLLLSFTPVLLCACQPLLLSSKNRIPWQHSSAASRTRKPYQRFTLRSFYPL